MRWRRVNLVPRTGVIVVVYIVLLSFLESSGAPLTCPCNFRFSLSQGCYIFQRDGALSNGIEYTYLPILFLEIVDCN